MARLSNLRLVRHALVLAGALGLFLLPASAQTSGAAKVVSLTGQVSVLRDNSPWVLDIGNIIQPKQLIVTGPDGYAVFEVLSDGSRFEVFPNSKTVFRANPSNWRDLLDVFIGRVKVHIQKLGGMPNNNSVHTQTAVISVRGTVFDVVVEDEDDTTLVSVDEGIVEVEHRLKPGRPRMLSAGESVRVFKNQPLTASSVDRSGIIRRVLGALEDAIYTAGRTANGGGSVPGGSTPTATGQGDKDKGAPPPSTATGFHFRTAPRTASPIEPAAVRAAHFAASIENPQAL